MNNGLLVVVPVLDAEIANPCIESILDPNSSAEFYQDELLLIDNTKNGLQTTRDIRIHRQPEPPYNVGVAAAWNIGAREVMERGLDYLVICSAVMLFGPKKECTFRWQMNQFWGENVIEADGHSWHLIAIHRRLFEEIGLFDENFHAYFEQTDWCRRLNIVGKEGGFARVWCNALSRGVAMHVDMVSCPADPLLRYYALKWGGAKGFEKFDKPFGDKPLDYWEAPSIPEMAEKYGWTTWW